MNALKQKKIAEILGISPQFLSDIAKGRKSLGKANAVRVAQITGIDLQTLLFLKGQEFLEALQSSLGKEKK